MKIIEPLAVLGCVALLAYVVGTQPGAAEGPPTSAPAAAGAALEPPVTYYVNNCARCHGPPDNAYQEFEKPKRGDELRQMIKIMAEGPALAPLDERGVRLQYDLHVAMLDKLPYAWIDPTRNDVIAGELIEGTTVALVTPAERIKAKVDEHRFELPKREGTIEIERDGKKATAK